MKKRTSASSTSPELPTPATSARKSRSWSVQLGQWIDAHRLLFAILVLGFLLRVATLWWGLPYSSESSYFHPDEVKSWSSTVGFPENYLVSKNFLYGTAVQYSVGLVLLPLKLLMVKAFGSPDSYAGVAVVLFRGVNVLLGTASILLAFHLGRRTVNERVGLLTAAFLAVAFMPALCSPLTTLDVPMSFFVVAGLLQLFRALESLQSRSFVVLGVIFGFLLGTKITGVLFLVVAAAWLLWQLPHRAPPSGRCWQLLAMFGLVTLIVFFISSPHVFLRFRDYVEFMQNQKTQWYDKASWSLVGIIKAWWIATSVCIGAPATLLSLAGFFAVGFRPSQHRGPVLLFVLVNYFFWLGGLQPRFVVPVAPLLCLLAAAACERLLVTRLVGWLAIGVALLWSTTFTALGIVQKTFDPRVSAARFIAEKLSEGAAIGIATDHGEQWQHHEWRYPPIDLSRFDEIYFVDRPEYVVVTALELDVMRPALQSPHLLADLRWDPQHNAEWYLSQPPPPEVFGFYRDLLAGTSYELLASFNAPVNVPLDGACPAVFIYQRKK